MSNFYEYESVQSAISHGRQHSGTSIASGGGGAMHPPGLPLYSGSPGARLDMPPPRHIPPPHFSQHPGNKGEIVQSVNSVVEILFRTSIAGIQGSNTLSVAPISSGKYSYYATTSRGSMNDYEEHRNLTMGPTMTDYDDPYGRVVFRDTRDTAGHQQQRRPSHPGTVSGHTVPHSGHRMQHSLSHPRIQSHQGEQQFSRASNEGSEVLQSWRSPLLWPTP